MLSRLIAAFWPRKAIDVQPAPARCVTQTHWPVKPQSTATEMRFKSRTGISLLPPSESEVQHDLSRVFLAYSSINDSHRNLFDRCFAIPVRWRDKVSADMIGTMDNLEGIAASLMSADVKLNVRELYVEHPVKRLTGEELRETKLNIQYAAEDMQYVRFRVDSVRVTIERLESDVMQHSQGDIKAG